jgi:muramoyltetrapeptide carboxypeptidase
MAPPPIPRIKPAALQRGDTIGIVAPASNIKRELLEAGCDALRKLGYKPLYGESILDRELYFAGSAQRRSSELNEMFAREDVRAIICARGGYGSNYLLESLDLDIIKAHPKIFMGYSDLTSVMTYILDATGLLVLHGPMVTKDFAHSGGVDIPSLEAALGGVSSWSINSGEDSGMKSLAPGVAEGILYGGCLSMLAASLGTPYEIHTAGTILFVEDVGAKPYQVDRMLMQLKLAGKLADVRGLVFGEMLDCVQNNNQDYTLEQIILRVVGDTNVPVAYGLRSGHVSRGNITLPLGVQARLEVDRDQASLRMLEPATAPATMASRTSKQ